ncbi:unnamed protein product [Lota lota]
MGLVGAIGVLNLFSTLLFFQIPFTNAQDTCEIKSVTSTGPSSLNVQWKKYVGATNYFLDLRVINSTDIAPVVLTLTASTTEKEVNGLRPGAQYSVTLKVFQFYFVVCRVTQEASTTPATSQITQVWPLTSTTVLLEWARVPTADSYFVALVPKAGQNHSLTVANTSVVFTGLTPRTVYWCSVFTENKAGRGWQSVVKAVLTLVPPPNNISALQTGSRTVRVSWQPVTDVLLYQVTVKNQDLPNLKPTVANATESRFDIADIRSCSAYLISVSSVNQFLQPGEPRNLSFTTNTLAPVGSVSVDYSCASNTAVVSWTPVIGADSYRATANRDGTAMSCTSQGTQCQLKGMACGQSYAVSVTAIAGGCESAGNANVTTFRTVPCPPDNLHLFRECSTNVIIYSWGQINYTDHYMATLVDSMGDTQHCMTTDLSCFFTMTTCGRSYNFTVYSVSGDCSSQSSRPSFVKTAPCPPENFITTAGCSSDKIIQTWDPAAGALSYVVEAYGNQGENDLHNCSSTGNSCTIRDLQCGQQLTTSITTFDYECASRTYLGAVAETVPCVPQNVSAVMDCGADSVTVNWQVAPGALFYTASAVDSGGRVAVCQTMGTSCQVPGLRCGTTYTAFVASSSFYCNSSQSDGVTVETAACPPDNVVASLDCVANQALISWGGQAHAGSYTATAVDPDDRLLSCSTTQQSCPIASLRCGQRYRVSVLHHDGICPSMPSGPVYMESVACGPANVTTRVNCSSATVEVRWRASRDADGYRAVLTRGDGQRLYCNSSTPLCSIDTMDCGHEHSVEVTSFRGTCPSFPSNASVAREAPCVPTNLTVQRNCGNSSGAEVTWQGSRGAARYDVSAAPADGGGGKRLGCSSNTSTACRLENLACGRLYNVSVVAVGDGCSSAPSDAVALRTAPCQPSQLTVSVDCSTNSAALTWDASATATSYSAQALGTDGHLLSCGGATRPACLLEGLRCGQRYVFTASAADGGCVSAASRPVEQTTAPCIPASVVNTVDCSSNALAVSWTAASIPVNYSVAAIEATGSSLACTTSEAGCVVHGLQCGKQYSVSVRAAGGPCQGPSSAAQTVRSAPCAPANLRRALECSSNTVEASWDPAPGALSYVSTLTDAHNVPTSCSTSFHGCSFPNMRCAQPYVFSVVALDNQCNSSISEGSSVTTAPCDPEKVVASLDCNSGVATVTWTAGAGSVQYYTVLAMATGQPQVSVQSNVTSCTLNQLRCGGEYTVIVLAGDGSCNSSVNASTTITTAPCAPQIQSHEMLLNCSSDQALVTWSPDAHAASFNVSATTTGEPSASCSTANASCVLANLSCGRRYTAQAVAQGHLCASVPSASFEILTAPCSPTNVESVYTCGSSIALLSWDESRGRDTFYASVRAGDHTDSCATAETHCSVLSLLCGRLYDVSVDAVAPHCNSSQSGGAQIQTAPCAPQNISASLVCSGNTGQVSWLASVGAVGYDVTAMGRDGDSKTCTTNTTTCSLPSMRCAQIYTITVTPYSHTCRGSASTPITFTAGPCQPSGVQASLQCEGNVGTVSWLPAVLADSYDAWATADDGHHHTCGATGGATHCSFTDLHCGESYAVTLATTERGCQSEPSAPVTLETALCPPANLTGVTSCTLNVIDVTWAPSPGASVVYNVYVGGHPSPAAAALPGTSYRHSGPQCGGNVSFAVSAQDTCASALSQTIIVPTIPCAPANLLASALCGTEMGVLTWSAGAGATGYVATVTGDHGHVASCSSNGTSCSVRLDCGRRYTAAVASSTAACNSSAVATVGFDSAPCLPKNISAELDCDSNSFAVRWDAGAGAAVSYMAVAIGGDGSRLSCNTSSTACAISALRCGLTYGVTVIPSTADCGDIERTDYQVQSAPCTPQGAGVVLECSTNVAVVSWSATGPDQVQVVTAVGSRGDAVTCNSSTTNCTFGQLSCGESYSLTVVGHTQGCQKQPSSALSLQTAPCVPTLPEATVDCDSNIAVVTWDSAPGSVSYTVSAEGSGGHNATCVDPDTTCSFNNLLCGQDYSLTVVARNHDHCESLPSQAITASTGPCPQTALQATLECSSNTAVVSWTPGVGILTYNSSAEALDTADHRSCTTSGPGCNISSLLCGERYRVSVRGEGRTCPSSSRDWSTITTAPCQPTGLSVASSCDSDVISVSWSASQGSDSYRAVAEAPDGSGPDCTTGSTDCQIAGLLCGQRYQVYVMGMNAGCPGPRSDVHTLHTAPCVPLNVHTELDCLAGSLNVTWQQSSDALAYVATVTSSSTGRTAACETTAPHCLAADLQCGSTYSVTVLAHDDTCNSSSSPVQHVATAPCPPVRFDPLVDCATNVVSVSWNGSTAGVLYTVAAAPHAGGRPHSCSAAHTGCSLGALECGAQYNVTVTPASGACVGSHGPPRLVRTAPCVPHLLAVEMDCLSESAWVMWEDPSHNLAQNYIVTSTDSWGHVQRFECNATDAVCAVPNMTCGRRLNFTLTASDQQCSSMPSNPIVTETAPCPPMDVRAAVGCENHTASVSWSPSPGALTYTATLEHMEGQTTCCSTAGSGCDIADLPCGNMFVLLVTAEGPTCNSSQSAGIIIRTEPCIPQNLQANLSCSSNVASLTWDLSLGGQQYVVEARSSQGGLLDVCRNYEGSCELQGLACGQLYTATVAAEDSDCTSAPSDSVEIRTAPCTPANMSTHVDCGDNQLTVSWSESAGADSYTAVIADADGQSSSCQAMEAGHCNLTGLSCGQVYRVSVVSSDGYCDSPPTDVVEAHSVPCATGYVRALMDCSSRTALLAWGQGAGALAYTATATPQSQGGSGGGGGVVACNTSQTTCEMGGLECGRRYSVSVSAQGDTCSSDAVHMSGELLTEPCVPGHISTEYALAIGQVLWDASAGTDHYTVDAVTSEGVAVSCRTSDTYCAMLGLGCSQLYNVTVTAHNSACNNSVESLEPVTIQTEPCPPNNVAVRVACEGNGATVTWEGSAGALGYVATADGRDGHSLSCHTRTTSCAVEGMHCGTVYYAWVVALGAELNSSDSNTIVMTSAPCVAGPAVVQVDCSDDTAAISWGSADGALSYALAATAAADGHRTSCETEDVSCRLTELLCGQAYRLELTAVNEQCRTLSPHTVTFSTRPCAPLHVGVDLQCGTNTASLHWELQESVESYVATANSSSTGYAMQCVSDNGTCQFTGLHCGESHQFSVVAHGGACQSDVSRTVEIQTEPCQPVALSVTGSCDSMTVTLDWTRAAGALAYVITAAGDLGSVTSVQTNDTTLEVELLCGQSYTFTAQAQGEDCDSPVGAAAYFTTAPCVPYNTECFTQCEDSLGSVSWSRSDGAESYTAVAVGHDGHTHMCATSSASCTWEDLHCGELYLVHVTAHDHLCASTPSNVTSIRMAPCIPQGLAASLNCSTKVATLTWNASEAADIYSVTAETGGGHVLSLVTVDTFAQFSEFLCGEEYFLSVSAVESVCRSAPSTPVNLKSAPCPPTAINSSMDCLSNIAVVTWTASAGAEFYTAVVTGEDGQSESCLSSSEQCGMPNLACGENYTVTVTASRQACDSDPSEPSALQSVPCVPSRVIVFMDCAAKEAAVSWDASQGVLSYAVSAMSELGAMSACASTGPECTLTNLTCGQSYRVQVLALDHICSSLPSRAAMFSTGPCQPEITAAALDCYSNTALLDWTHSEGALSYVTTARTAAGDAVRCTANSTNCELEPLECGRTYTATTVATGQLCDSEVSGGVTFDSVPCPPSSVATEQDCSASAARVTWRPEAGADSHLVRASGGEEHTVDCESDAATGACLLTGLRCSSTYNVTVLAINSECNVTESAVTLLHTVPCVPNLVHAHLDCESGAVSVSWEASHGALSYITVAQGNGGYSESCNATGTTCRFDGLPCGLSYGVTVRALGEACSSDESAPVHVDTVPCAPHGVAAVMECSNDTGLVSWERAEGGASYQVRAVGADGHAPVCSSTGDRCQLPSMHCGQHYNLTVTVLDGLCDNVRFNLDLQSVPCRPTNVRTSAPQCPSALASVTWEHASGALSYAAEAVTAGGAGAVWCNATTATSCQLRELLCGHTYNVSLVARDEGCDSMESEVAHLTTAPCPPQDVALAVRCKAGGLTVSWSPNPDADSFVATLVSNTAARHLCVSDGTNCSVENLPCGQRFSVSVVAAKAGCESEASAPVEISSAPCVPQKPTGSLDCVTNSAWVSWDGSAGALRYTAVAEALGGDHGSSCTSLASSPSCNIPNLKCGTEYAFHIVAANGDCLSGNSSAFTLQTGPCALENITAANECGSNRILVSWQNTAESPLYLVTAEGRDRSLISCNSTSSYCELQGADCGMLYTVIVSASSDKCSSLRSTPMEVTTAPCVPGSVVAGVSCEDDGAVVSWTQSSAASSFLLTATGASGDVRTCQTTHTNCTLSQLPCGEMYAVNVTASDHSCSSRPSADIFFQTMPCQPTGLSVDYQCETNWAVLSWTASEGSVEYYSYASPEVGDAQLFCNTTETSCSLPLACGGLYNLSVLASDLHCNSSLSAPLRFGAAPCAPASLKVRVRVIGDKQLAMASWPAVRCPGVEYLVSLSGRVKDDPRAVMELLSYPTNRLYYEFPVPCSTVFNLTVQALNGGGVSDHSHAFNGVTAPCTPADVTYSGDSEQHAVLVSWGASVFATRYTVYNASGAGRAALCTTAALSCSVAGVAPASLVVTASNGVGESGPSTNITGPVLVRGRRDLRSAQLLAHVQRGLSVPQVVHMEVRGASLHVEWTPVLEAAMYTVIVKEDQATRPALVLTVDTEFYTTGELKPLTHYCVILSAKNAFNQSPYSTPECMTTGAPI